MRCGRCGDAFPQAMVRPRVTRDDRAANGNGPPCLRSFCMGEVGVRIRVVGGGPAGLYFAHLWKTRHPRSAVMLMEQNPADATFGFGVVFSEQAMTFLRADDPDTADLITAQMEMWSDLALVHRGERITIDGVGFAAIGRPASCGATRRAGLPPGDPARTRPRREVEDVPPGPVQDGVLPRPDCRERAAPEGAVR